MAIREMYQSMLSRYLGFCRPNEPAKYTAAGEFAYQYKAKRKKEHYSTERSTLEKIMEELAESL